MKRKKSSLFIIFITIIFLQTIVSGQNIKYSVSSYKLKQGETLRIDIKSTAPIKKGTVLLDKKKFQIFEKKSSKKNNRIKEYITYIGISRYIKPQKHTLTLSLEFKKGNKVNKKTAITIVKGHFKKSTLLFTGKKKTLSQNKKQLSKESSLLGKRFKKITPYPLFNSPFIIPTIGKTTTTFGAYRSYNGKSTGKHSGVDFANKIGTPINAANSGIVILSDPLKSNGNSIIIDHGLGILSVYTHLDKRLVKEGQKIKKGEKIGLMGETGIATGPHLHWGLSIQNVRVDPLFWIKKTTLYKK